MPAKRLSRGVGRRSAAELVHDSKVAVADDLVEEAANDRLVVFGRHLRRIRRTVALVSRGASSNVWTSRTTADATPIAGPMIGWHAGAAIWDTP
jgi:hypothetical protein